jgi:hypothetical protein
MDIKALRAPGVGAFVPTACFRRAAEVTASYGVDVLVLDTVNPEWPWSPYASYLSEEEWVAKEGVQWTPNTDCDVSIPLRLLQASDTGVIAPPLRVSWVWPVVVSAVAVTIMLVTWVVAGVARRPITNDHHHSRVPAQVSGQRRAAHAADEVGVLRP